MKIVLLVALGLAAVGFAVVPPAAAHPCIDFDCPGTGSCDGDGPHVHVRLFPNGIPGPAQSGCVGP